MRMLASLSLVLSLTFAVSACSSGEEPGFRPVAHSRRGEGAEGSAADGEGERRGPTDRTTTATTAPTPAPAIAEPAAIAVDPTEVAEPDIHDPSTIRGRAPDDYVVELDTTEGTITLDVHRAWAPNGADRFYALVRAGYYTDIAFFRVIAGFMAQAGIHGDPAISRAWQNATIPDDPVVEHNTRGMVSFATGGPNTRTTQFFISFADNTRLDAMGFSPFARVRDMAVVDRLYAEYGEGAPRGTGPAQARINREGNAYLHEAFPELDYIRSARIVE